MRKSFVSTCIVLRKRVCGDRGKCELRRKSGFVTKFSLKE